LQEDQACHGQCAFQRVHVRESIRQ
jgi:hypothetical protein